MVRAPPRVLSRSLAPSGVIRGGGGPVPVPPYLAWGCAPPVGRVRGVRVPGGGFWRGGAARAPCPPFVRPGGPVGRGVALPRSVPLPSLGRQQSGCHWRRAGEGGRGPHTTPVRARPPSLCGVLARWRRLACSPRFLWEPAAGAGGRALLWLLSRAEGGGTIPPASGGGGRRPRGLRAGGGVGGGGVARGLPAPPLGGGLRFPTLAPRLSSVHSRPVCAFGWGRRAAPGGGGMRGSPWTAPPGALSDLNPPSALPEWAMVMGVVMGGAAPVLFWCAAVHRPQAWSASRSGALVWARPSAATPAGAGGWGRWGARCAGPAASPPPVSRSLLGEGGRPLGSGGVEGRSCGPQAGGGGAGGGGGGAPPPPAPPPRRASACHPLSPARPPGVYSCRGGCRAAAGVGRGPVGRQWVSAAGGQGRGGEPPRPGLRPRLPQAGL